MTNITKFPSSGERRDSRNLKSGIVECQVSGRWLQFPEKVSEVGDKGFMVVDVMTLGIDETPRKLCEMILAKEDLIAMLVKIKTAY